MTTLRQYSDEKSKWITLMEGDFYPDSVSEAIRIYHPTIERFGALLNEAKDSRDLLKLISEKGGARDRVQLLRIFRKYVSPDTAVEMLKRQTDIPDIIAQFGERFRDLGLVRQQYARRPSPDEALIALLNEYRERGQKGYTLTEAFFKWFSERFAGTFEMHGPTGAGKDLNLGDWLKDYPKERRPIDFIITERGKRVPLVIGLARYDSDRGGAQEDDRTSGYRDVITEVLSYAEKVQPELKLMFLNDGPGLLLGSMWKDYCELEDRGKGRVMVATLRMLDERLTSAWILS